MVRGKNERKRAEWKFRNRDKEETGSDNLHYFIPPCSVEQEVHRTLSPLSVCVSVCVCVCVCVCLYDVYANPHLWFDLRQTCCGDGYARWGGHSELLENEN